MAVVTGGDGPDVLTGTDVIDRITGGAGDDVLAGRDGSDVIEGGAGDDTLYGWGEADRAPDSGLISAVRVASGFASPVFAASPPGQPDLLYVLEKDEGRVRVLDLATGQVRPTPFLDIPQEEFARVGERGVLGLAFHPEYAANGRFFVYLTAANGDLQLREYVRGPDGLTAEPAPVRVMLTIPHATFSNHNGGSILFGPDGLLYVNTGDGGGSGDPNNNAQNIDSLLGKVLRLDVNGDSFPGDPARNYAIPASNPFVGRDGADEVFAYGLRNPYRASFDRLTGDFYIGDVGEAQREEVDVIRAGSRGGENFGWRIKEGTTVFSPTTPPGPGSPDLIDPVLDYARDALGGRSVTGGVVNRGPGGAQGVYVFGDFISGNLFSAKVVDGAAQDFLLRNAQVRTDVGTLNLPAAFAEDGRGRVYVIGFDGEIHRLDFSAAAGDGGDLLLGGAGNDRIFGGAGDDRVGGQDGDDLIDGGMGADQLFGDAGDDIIGGREGDDFLNGNAGRDLLVGDAGNDLAIGGFGDDELRGGDGDDRMGGQEDNDFLNGEGGRDFLFGDAGNDFIIGGRGNDELRGGDGDDRMGGQEDNDFLDGGEGRDALFGDSGDDLVIGGTGADELIGGAGEDRMGGQDGDDFLNGETGRDFLFGDGGNDLILGGLGADELRGGEGDDRIGGQEDNDFLDGERGRDFLFGDAGDDLILGGFGDDELRGGDGSDRLGGQEDNDFLDGGQGRDFLFGDAGNDHLVGGGDNDELRGGDGDDLMGGQDGDDFIDGGLGRDTIFGDAGDDRILGGAGDDRLDGGGGLDTAVFRGARSAYTITTSNGVTTVSGADGTDTLVGIERLQFDDGLFGAVGSPEDAAPAWVEPLAPAPVAADWTA